MEQRQGGIRRIRPRAAVSVSTLVLSMVLVGVVAFIGGTRSHEIRLALGKLTGQIDQDSGQVDFARAQKVYEELLTEYDGDLDRQALADGAARGLAAATGDMYTQYMDAEETAEFEKSLSGDIGAGIGAEVGIRAGQPTIVRVIPGNPAETAGLKAGDVIVGINDVATRNWPLDKTVGQLRGEVGSTVKVSVQRGEESKEVSITRAVIDNPSVQTSTQDGVGVIRMTRFDQETGMLARNAVLDFKTRGVKGVILDLRDNGGGYVTAAQEVAGLWLKDQPIMSEKRGDKVVATLKSRGEPILQDTPTVVLINGGSASASEIIAGALKEYNKATLIGERSFGKGSVQKVISLPGGATLKVTIARWYTPKGKNITKDGIHPDKEVVLSVAEVDAGKDTQLEAAKQHLSQ